MVWGPQVESTVPVGNRNGSAGPSKLFNAWNGALGEVQWKARGRLSLAYLIPPNLPLLLRASCAGNEPTPPKIVRSVIDSEVASSSLVPKSSLQFLHIPSFD
jgi:hypothetical protein